MKNDAMGEVRPGQKYVHVPSGDERTVVDIVDYEYASGGYPPSDFHKRYGITHVARLASARVVDGNVWFTRDRRFHVAAAAFRFAGNRGAARRARMSVKQCLDILADRTAEV